MFDDKYVVVDGDYDDDDLMLMIYFLW